MTNVSNSFWATLKRTITLRPFGDSLLGSKAATWLVMAWIAITQMAAVEGLAWGYAATLVAPNGVRLIVGWGAGLVVFMLVWGLDASLISLDRESPRLEAKLSSQEIDCSGSADVGRSAVWIGVVARTLVVGISLFITAPFVSQYVFREEVESELRRRSVDSLRDARSKLVEQADEDVESGRRALELAQEDLESEIAGTLSEGSGRYGEGPVSAAIPELLTYPFSQMSG